ncbi:MAG: major facilitator superfamily permease, partial [Nocardioidaceae bacterium]|nr:major facilitator superfamily permease [Nocardioidaceae bacterium]
MTSTDHDVRRSTPDGFDRRLTLPLVLGSVLNPINSTMLAVALVPIGAAFGEPPSRTAWLVSALYLTTAVGQPVVGRLVDLFGPRRLYLAATALVGVAGLMGAFAQSLDWLVVSRVLLGLGTCSAFPAAMFLLRSEAVRTGQDAPTSVLTLLSVGNQTIAVIGPTLGGLLVGLGGWRLIFTVNVPLSIACLALGALRLPRRTPVLAGEPVASVSDLDLPGIVLFGGALLSLMGFLMLPAVDHLWFLAVAVGAAVLLVVRELRARTPFIDLRVLGGNRPLVATYVRQALAGVVMYAFLYGFVQWLEDGRHLSASHAGLLLLPMSATAVVVSLVVGRRPQLWAKVVVGSVALVVATSGLLRTDGGSPIWWLAVLT